LVFFKLRIFWFLKFEFIYLLCFFTYSYLLSPPTLSELEPHRKNPEESPHSHRHRIVTQRSRPWTGAHRRRAAGGCAVRLIVCHAGSARLHPARVRQHMLLAQSALFTRWARQRGANAVSGFGPDQHGARCWSGSADTQRARAWRALAPDVDLCGCSCGCGLRARPFALAAADDARGAQVAAVTSSERQSVTRGGRQWASPGAWLAGRSRRWGTVCSVCRSLARARVEFCCRAALLPSSQRAFGVLACVCA
jgi:hypothetical protein